MHLTREIEILIYFFVCFTFFIIVPNGGHDGDLFCWASWSIYNFKNGLGYAYNGWTDYMPLYQYVLYFFGHIQGNEELIKENIYQLKLFTFLFDLAGFFLIINLLKTTFDTVEKRVLLFIFLLLNPAYFYNTIIWGQVDAIMAALCFTTFILLYRQKVILASITYCLALNMKLQSIIFLPLFFIMLYPLIKNKGFFLKLGISIITFLVTQAFILLPFYKTGTTQKFFEVIIKSFGKYPVVSMNAYNMWHLILTGDLMQIKDNTIWFGLSYKQWGLLCFFSVSFLAFLPIFKLIFNHLKNKITVDKDVFLEKTLIIGALIPLMFFFFNTEMHERYVHPSMIFITAYCVLKKDYLLFILFSIANLLSHGVAEPNPLWNLSLFFLKKDVIALLFLGIMSILFYKLYDVKYFSKEWFIKNVEKNNIRQICLWLGLLIIIYFPIFGYLTQLPIQIWDESRLTTNAYEMYYNHNWLVPHFEGKPDMWNTKPPLMIWLQVLFLNIIGFNELAIRLPAAIAAFLTTITIFLLFQKIEKNNILGFLAVIILITSSGFIGVHASRTGDYDALLTMCSTLAAIMFYIFIEKKENKYLYIMFLCIILGIYAKSITILMFCPAMLVYAIIKRQVGEILLNKHFYIGIFSTIFFVALYYISRENVNEGYLQAVMTNELGGRFLNETEKHGGNFLYYIKQFTANGHFKWFLCYLICSGVTFFYKENRYKNLFLYSCIVSWSYFLIISISKTKLQWYDMPIYPFLAIQTSIGIYVCYNFIKERYNKRNEINYTLMYSSIISLCIIYMYVNIIQSVLIQKPIVGTEQDNQIPLILKEEIKGKHNLNGYVICNEIYSPQIMFYINILKQKNVNIIYKYKQELKEGEKVLTNIEYIDTYIEQNFEYKKTHLPHYVRSYELTRRKQTK